MHLWVGDGRRDLVLNPLIGDKAAIRADPSAAVNQRADDRNNRDALIDLIGLVCNRAAVRIALHVIAEKAGGLGDVDPDPLAEDAFDDIRLGRQNQKRAIEDAISDQR